MTVLRKSVNSDKEMSKRLGDVKRSVAAVEEFYKEP